MRLRIRNDTGYSSEIPVYLSSIHGPNNDEFTALYTIPWDRDQGQTRTEWT